jgi:aminoglycoside phosphotransferase (APT) family kinase protein
MAARLPRIEWAIGQVAKEARWLPELAPHLPLPISAPVAVGAPGEGFPWEWCVAPWFEGEDATPAHLDDLITAAKDLGAFVSALQRIDASAGPAAGTHNFNRGVPLAAIDAQVRRQIPEWEGEFDTGAITAAWEAAVSAPQWDGPPVWLHGDLLPVNMISNHGRLAAVIDFGCLGVGDPAADLVPAWALFAGRSREVFREVVAADEATWARARGWALRSVGALPYYRDTNPGIVARSRHQIAELLADLS